VTIKDQIRLAKDADLFLDLAKYKKAIERNEFPIMIPEWKATVDLLEYEIEQRCLLASAVPRWAPTVLIEAPF